MLSSHDIKDKAKYKPTNTGFCNYVFCMRTVQLRDDNTCMRCGSPVAKKEITYDAVLERFEKICIQNEYAFNNHIFSDLEMNSLKIPVLIGTGNKDYFFVPLRYFIEYQNFKHTENYKDNKKSMIEFIEHIKSVSPKVRL